MSITCCPEACQVQGELSVDCADARLGRGKGRLERPRHTPMTGRGRGVTCPWATLTQRSGIPSCQCYQPQAFLTDLSLPYDTPGAAEGATTPKRPVPGHGHALYLQGEVMLHQGWGRCTTLGCAKLWAGRRWGVSQVLLPPALVRLTQGPAMWTNLMLLGRVRLGRQQVEGGGHSRDWEFL